MSRAMHRPSYGGRRMVCAQRDTRGAAAVARVSERIPEQCSRASCSEMRSDMHTIVVALRIARFAHSMRRPPCGGRRV
eukprot:1563983-Lingulodinium_polyedra.AAC.1